MYFWHAIGDRTDSRWGILMLFIMLFDKDFAVYGEVLILFSENFDFAFHYDLAFFCRILASSRLASAQANSYTFFMASAISSPSIIMPSCSRQDAIITLLS